MILVTKKLLTCFVRGRVKFWSQPLALVNISVLKSGHAPYDYIIETKEKGRRNWHKADPTNAKEEA